MDLPPREVPEGLSAAEYYKLGVQYKSMGWTEQARDALTLAVEDESDMETNVQAKRFLRTKIPRFPVPLLAEQKNIEGFNLMATGDVDAAKITFEELIDQFPDFEWPYGNLAVLCLHSGEIPKAKELLEKALSINPDYVNGWLHMATAKGLELDLEGARKCVERALQSDPTDTAAKAMRDALDEL
ncbi:MAG TPA: tetratricopeptide repeat protein [Drouetiella sp.]